MAIHELYERMAEQIKANPQFREEHYELYRRAMDQANQEEGDFIQVAMQEAVKDHMLVELSRRLLTGENELETYDDGYTNKTPKRIITTPDMHKAANELLRKQIQESYKEHAKRIADELEEERTFKELPYA